MVGVGLLLLAFPLFATLTFYSRLILPAGLLYFLLDWILEGGIPWAPETTNPLSSRLDWIVLGMIVSLSIFHYTKSLESSST